MEEKFDISVLSRRSIFFTVYYTIEVRPKAQLEQKRFELTVLSDGRGNADLTTSERTIREHIPNIEEQEGLRFQIIELVKTEDQGR